SLVCKFSVTSPSARNALLLHRTQEFRRHEPAQPSGARRKGLHVDSADRALLELNRIADTRKTGGQLANSRLVTHDPKPRASGLLLDIRHDAANLATGDER